MKKCTRPLKILVLYYYIHEYPMRSTIRDHLYSFRKYSNTKCFYVNIGITKLPKYILNIKFDLIIFHTALLSCRWGGSNLFRYVANRIAHLKDYNAIKIALPQDEFIYCDDLCSFINDFRVEHVFSVTPKSEWQKIYSTVDFKRVRFHEVLTGYLDEHTTRKIEQLSNTNIERDIDIGYRAYRAPQWLGRHGFFKSQIADIFKQEAPKFGLNIDISTDPKDTILGDDWYRYLLRCKYIIGVEGGSTVMDREGSIKDITEEYLKSNPQANFEEVEKACFPGIDGYLKCVAISPRQLEACMTKTCQILIEGRYNNILKPGEHYISLKSDFSNIEEVLEMVKKDVIRKDIIEAAYHDIVETGKYTYRSFVNLILEESMKDSHTVSVENSICDNLLYYYYYCFRDLLTWYLVWFRCQILYPSVRLFRSVIRRNINWLRKVSSPG